MKSRYIYIILIVLMMFGIESCSASAPISNFYGEPTFGTAPLTVYFYDLSENTPTTWMWDLDGDGDVDSNEQNPSFTYTKGGYYTVVQTVLNSDGANTSIRHSYIYVGAVRPTYTPAPTLRANFVATSRVGNAPLNVVFTERGLGDNYFCDWDFGDGTVIQNASSVVNHTYTTQGKYTVKLTIYNSNLSNTISNYNYVYVVGNVTPIPTTTFGVHATELLDANYNVTAYSEILPTAFTDIINSEIAPQIFWGTVFLFVFIALFMRVGDVPLLVLFGLLAASSILVFIPGEWQPIAQGFLVVGLGAVFYILVKGRFR